MRKIAETVHISKYHIVDNIGHKNAVGAMGPAFAHNRQAAQP